MMAGVTIKINQERILPIRSSENAVIGEAKVTEEIVIGKIESWEPSNSRVFPESKINVKRKIFKRE